MESRSAFRRTLVRRGTALAFPPPGRDCRRPARAERVVQLSRDRRGFLQLGDRAVGLSGKKSVPAEVVEAVIDADDVTGLSLEPKDLLAEGTSRAEFELGRRQWQEHLRALPRVGELAQKCHAALHGRRGRLGFAPLDEDPGEICKSRGLDRREPGCSSGFRCLPEVLLRDGEVTLEEGELRGREESDRPVGFRDALRGSALSIQPRPSVALLRACQ